MTGLLRGTSPASNITNLVVFDVKMFIWGNHFTRCLPPKIRVVILQERELPLVIDADGLWLIEQRPDLVAGAPSTQPTTWTQTPFFFWRFNPEIFRIMLEMVFSCVKRFGKEMKTLQLSTTQCCASNLFWLCFNFAILYVWVNTVVLCRKW